MQSTPTVGWLPRPGAPGAAFAAAVAQRGAQSVPMGLDREQLQRSLRSGGGGGAHSGERDLGPGAVTFTGGQPVLVACSCELVLVGLPTCKPGEEKTDRCGRVV